MVPEQTAQRELALTLLARRTGPAAGAEAVAAAAGRAYNDLAQVLAPVIGDVGLAAMTDRAVSVDTWVRVVSFARRAAPTPSSLRLSRR